MPPRFLTLQNIFFGMSIIFASALCAAAPNSVGQDISAKTRAMIVERFGKLELVEGSRPLFSIQNNLKVSDSEDVVEGQLARLRILPERGAESYAVYVDGNREPFVSELIPGPSMSGNYFEVSVKLDEGCGGKYKIVVVEKLGSSLRANIRNLRTHIADCHGQ